MAQDRFTKIISTIKWIWTSRLAMKNSLFSCGRKAQELGVDATLADILDAKSRPNKEITS